MRSYSQLALGPDWQVIAQAARTKPEAAYRPATGKKRCGGCVMFREGKAHDWCTKVKGAIEADHVCRFWYGRGKTAATGYDGLTDRSAMLYLPIPEGLVQGVRGGVGDYHVTVCYLGKSVSEEAFGHALQRAAGAAAAHHPMDGILHGIDTFPAKDGKTPAFVPAYIPGIGSLVRRLQDLSASEHKHHRPHVTLAYLEDGEPLPPPHPPVRVAFTHLHARRGGQVVRFPLGR